MTNELYHFGIKGMKWGVRRTDAELGNETPSQKGNRIGKKIASTGVLGAVARARKNRDAKIRGKYNKYKDRVGKKNAIDYKDYKEVQNRKTVEKVKMGLIAAGVAGLTARAYVRSQRGQNAINRGKATAQKLFQGVAENIAPRARVLDAAGNVLGSVKAKIH